MFETLKILHLLALMFGAAAGLGNFYIIKASGPDDMPPSALTMRLRNILRFTGLAAIITIWASGIWLMLIECGWWVDSRFFDIKILFATIVLVIVLALNVIASRMAKGAKPPSYLPTLSTAGTASLIITMMLAVLTFNS